MEGCLTWWAFFTFGAAPWLLVNTIFAELPVFIAELPEGVRLGALIGSMVQIGNVSLFAYLLFRHRWGLCDKKSIAAVLTVLLALCLLSTWLILTTVNGTSYPLFVITILAGFCGCVSKVTWFPFAARYGPKAISAASTGMGLSGILCIVLSVAQGLAQVSDPDPDPVNATTATHSIELNFSVAAAFFAVAGVMGSALASFVYISFFAVESGEEHSPLADADGVSSEDEDDAESHAGLSDSVASAPYGMIAPRDAVSADTAATPWLSVLSAGKGYVLVSFANALMNYFVMPGLMPFLTQPGHSSVGMFWQTALYYVGNTLGRSLPTAPGAPLRRLWLVAGALGVHTGYLIALAVINDSPFFATLTGGYRWWMAVAAPVLTFSALNGFLATSVNLVRWAPAAASADCCAGGPAGTLVRKGDQERLLQLIGVGAQVGSICGTYTSLGVAYALPQRH